MSEDLVKRVNHSIGRIIFKLPKISEEAAIELYYGFLEYLGEPVETKHKKISEREGEIDTYKFFEKNEKYSGVGIRLMREDSNKEGLQIDIGGHTSSEILLKMRELAPILHSYLKTKVKELIK